MNTSIKCQIAGNQVTITNNAIKTTNQSLQIELIKRLIDCKSLVKIGDCALALFYNKYLKFYPLEAIQFVDENQELNKIGFSWEQNLAA